MIHKFLCQSHSNIRHASQKQLHTSPSGYKCGHRAFTPITHIQYCSYKWQDTQAFTSKGKNPPHFQVINFRDIIWMRLKATNGTLASRDKEGGSVWGWPRTRAQKLRTFRRTMFSVGWTCQWASERTFHSVIPDSNSFSSWHCVFVQDTTSSKSAQDRRQTKPGNLYNQSDKDNEVWTRTGAMGTAGN